METVDVRAQRQEQALFMTVEEAATKLGIGRSTLYRLAAHGEIPSIKVGARRLVAKAAIERILAKALGEGQPEA